MAASRSLLSSVSEKATSKRRHSPSRSWLTLLDADLTPKGALPYLAQFVGERLPLGIPEADARLWIKDHPNQRRGTLASIISTAKRRLTGDKSVLIRERDEAGGGGDNPDRISVVTYTSETPDPAATYKDLRAIVPADIVLNYEVFEGQTWNEVLTHGTWQDVMDDYPTWRDVFEDTP